MAHLAQSNEGPWANIRGSVVNITAWIGVSYAGLAIIVKLITKLTKRGRIDLDDLLALFAMMLVIAFTCTINIAVAGGLGKHWNDVAPDQRQKFERAFYASELLYLSGAAVSKATTFLLTRMLAPVGWVIWLANKGILITAVWLACALLVLAFQCGVPQPWDFGSGHCINQMVLWVINGCIDLITEVALLIVPSKIMWDLQVSWQTKLSISAAFIVRAANIPAIIVRLFFLKSYYDSPDRTYDAVKPAMITVAHLTFAICSMCFPFMQKFIGSTRHGGFSPFLLIGPRTFLKNQKAKRERARSAAARDDGGGRERDDDDADWQRLRDLPAPHGVSGMFPGANASSSGTRSEGDVSVQCEEGMATEKAVSK